MAAHDPTTPRLRIPAALVVAVVGTTASLAMGFGSCRSGMPEPIDAKPVNIDAGTDGGRDDVADADNGPRGCPR